MFPLAQVIFARIAGRITHHRTVALLSVLLWTILPVVIYAVMALIHRAELGAIWAVHLPWMQMLSDPPTAFFTVLSFWLLFYTLDTTNRRNGLIGSALLGIISGFLLLIRLNAILSLLAVGLVLVWSRRWRTLILVMSLAFIIFLPQLAYNAAHFGNVLTTGYQVYGQPSDGLLNIAYPLKILTGQYGLAISVIALFLGLLIIVALITLWQRDQNGALAVGAWSIAYLVFFSLYYFSWVGGFVRFLIPAYPALALLAATAIMRIANLFNRSANAVAEVSA